MNKTLIFAACVLGLFATGVEAGSMKRIKTEADFRAVVVDKKLTSSVGWAIAKSNGMLGGKFTKGKYKGKLKGAWNWQKGYYCRAVKVGKKDFGSTCNVIHSDGMKVEFIRDKGKGTTSSWTIN